MRRMLCWKCGIHWVKPGNGEGSTLCMACRDGLLEGIVQCLLIGCLGLLVLGVVLRGVGG